MLQQPRTLGLLANDPQQKGARGFILVRIAADESEVLTIGVVPEERKRGVGTELMTEAAKMAASQGAVCLFLEVGRQNIAARRLYGKLGFEQVGTRGHYYRRGGAPTEDACVLKASLPLAQLA